MTPPDEPHLVLAEYPADLHPHAPIDLGAAGGFSGARLWRMESSAGPLCLRCWPLEHPTPERLRLIHAVLKHVDRQGFREVPVPLPTRRGATFVEHDRHLWELTPWMPGRADYHDRPSPARLAAALAALARFHLAAASFDRSDAMQASPGILARRLQIEELWSGGAARIQRAVASVDWPELQEQARRWLAYWPQAAPRVEPLLADAARQPVVCQPCLRDIWHDHLLFSGDKVSGIVDFGALRVECVSGDLARLLGSLVADDRAGWRQGIAVYETLRPLSAGERRLVAAFDVSGVLISPANWFRWILVEGRRFDDRDSVAGRIETQLRRLTHWLQSSELIWP